MPAEREANTIPDDEFIPGNFLDDDAVPEQDWSSTDDSSTTDSTSSIVPVNYPTVENTPELEEGVNIEGQVDVVSEEGTLPTAEQTDYTAAREAVNILNGLINNMEEQNKQLRTDSVMKEVQLNVLRRKYVALSNLVQEQYTDIAYLQTRNMMLEAEVWSQENRLQRCEEELEKLKIFATNIQHTSTSDV